MLSPPLGLLSGELLDHIVDLAAEELGSKKTLKNLSLTDRAFTRIAQSHLFKLFNLGEISKNKESITRKLIETQSILDHDVSFAYFIRIIRLTIRHDADWLSEDPKLDRILVELENSPRSPRKLEIKSSTVVPPSLVDRLLISPLSQSLTSLTISDCWKIPISLFLLSPNIIRLCLYTTGIDESYEYPEEMAQGRSPPRIEHFDYCDSHRAVKHLVKPLSHQFSSSCIRFDTLRVLYLTPQIADEVLHVPLLLNAAAETLEELHLIRYTTSGEDSIEPDYIPLAPLIDLRPLSALRVFSLLFTIKSKIFQPQKVLQDVIAVLQTTKSTKTLDKLRLEASLHGSKPFKSILEEDWEGLAAEAVRLLAPSEDPAEQGGKNSFFLRASLGSTGDGKPSFSPVPNAKLAYKKIGVKLAQVLHHPGIRSAYLHPPESFSWEFDGLVVL